VPVFRHIAANVVWRAEFAAANLAHAVPYLRFEPDAGPASRGRSHCESGVSARFVL
jgi:hypothetical protein